MWHWFEKIGSVVILAALARSVFITYLSTKLATLMDAFVERYIIKTEKQAAIWIHYKLRGRHEGHSPKKPADCSDGSCVIVK